MHRRARLGTAPRHTSTRLSNSIAFSSAAVQKLSPLRFSTVLNFSSDTRPRTCFFRVGCGSGAPWCCSLSLRLTGRAPCAFGPRSGPREAVSSWRWHDLGRRHTVLLRIRRWTGRRTAAAWCCSSRWTWSGVRGWVAIQTISFLLL